MEKRNQILTSLFLLVFSALGSLAAASTEGPALSQGVIGISPLGEVTLEEGASFSLRIDLAGAFNLDMTDGRFVRIFDTETGQQVFAVDPEPGYPGEGTDALEIAVDTSRFVPGKQYRVTVDHLFARLDREPWSAGAIPGTGSEWLFTVSRDSVLPEPPEDQPTLPLTPVAGINGVLPLGDVDISGKSEVLFQIESVYAFHFDYTEGNRIRIIKASTEEEVFSFDPEPGIELDVPTRLAFSVPADLFDENETYYVTADHLFARVHGEPWNIGKIPAGAWPLNIQSGSIADRQIEEIREFLESDVPPISDEEFVETEFYKQQMDPMTKRRLDRAHSLALSAVDPDPLWHSTRIERTVVYGAASSQYTLGVEKLDIEGNVIGPVNATEMEAVVRIQRENGDFDYIPTEFNQDYVVLSQGTLTVSVPEDMEKGRVLVGLRPKLADVGQKVLAERWSTFVSIEVWPARSGVVTIQEGDVLFPVSSEEPFRSETLFSAEDIRQHFEYWLDEGILVLPLVVEGGDYSVDDLVDYRLGNDVYGGRVHQVVNRAEQQLLLLTPEWFDVYDVVPAADGFLIEQGVMPEFVVYRSGPAMEGFDSAYRSDLTFVGPEERASFEVGISEIRSTSIRTASASGKGFLKFDGCSIGLTGSVVFSPEFTLSPMEVGAYVTGAVKGVKGECSWVADIGQPINLIRAAGPAAIIAESLLGAGAEVQPQGSIKIGLEINSDTVNSFEGKFGWTSEKGAVAENNIGIPDDFMGLVRGFPQVSEASIGGGVGLTVEFAALKEDSILGRITKWVGARVSDVKIEAGVEFELGLAATAADAAAAYAGQKSDFALKLGASGKIEFSKVLTKLFDYLDLKGVGNLAANIEGKPLKAEFDFSGEVLSDDGVGSAAVGELQLKSDFLQMIYGGSANPPKGWVAPQSTESSVFEDDSRVIRYETDECESQPNNTIKAPVVACIGAFCGKTEELAFCGGLAVSPLIGIGEIGETVNVSSTVMHVGSEYAGMDLRASNTSFEVSPAEFYLVGGEQQKVGGEYKCVGSGAYGDYVVKTVDGDHEVKQTSVIVCTSNGDQPGDRVWGSPHLTTTDGFAYDYYASGDYILSTIPGAKGYQIQARFVPGYDVSWPVAMAIQVGDDVVEIFSETFVPPAIGWVPPSDRLRIFVNGQELMEAGKYHTTRINPILTLPGGGRILVDETVGRMAVEQEGGAWVDPTGVYVLWPVDNEQFAHVVHVKTFNFDQSEWEQYKDVPPLLEISIDRDERFSGIERGLLGNMDGDPSNDLIRRNGQVLDTNSLSWTNLYALFGGDWLVRPQECLFTRGCIEPRFPREPMVLTPEQRVIAEIACNELEGWYYDACIHDVGLTGQPTLVQEYYANTGDLNHLAGLITQPAADIGLYQAAFGTRNYEDSSSTSAPVYSRDVIISMLSGSGDYQLLARPPRGGSLVFANGATSMTGSGGLNTSFTLDCRVPDPYWEDMGEAWPERGHVQLWSVDNLSGNLGELLAELTLSCDEGIVSALNDTGVDRCYFFIAGGFGACPGDEYGQDGDYGRDKLASDGDLAKIGTGPVGFDFTKLGVNGEELPNDAADWSCVKDNHTGLIWERKMSSFSSLHFVHRDFTWYSSDEASNGGSPGADSMFTTERFVELTNQEGLCGYADWRVPSVNELHSIRRVSGDLSEVDPFFGDVNALPIIKRYFWTREATVDPDKVWAVAFLPAANSTYMWNKGGRISLRLVRGGVEQ